MSLRAMNRSLFGSGKKTLDLQVGAETAHASSLDGHYSLSFWTLPRLSGLELALRVAIALGREGGSFRISTVGRMAAAGFDLIDVRPNGHCSVRFDDLPTEDDCARLRAAFDDPVPNPYRR